MHPSSPSSIIRDEGRDLPGWGWVVCCRRWGFLHSRKTEKHIFHSSNDHLVRDMRKSQRAPLICVRLGKDLQTCGNSGSTERGTISPPTSARKMRSNPAPSAIYARSSYPFAFGRTANLNSLPPKQVLLILVTSG